MDMNDMMEQLSNIKEKLAALAEELKNIKIEGTDSDKILTAIVSGNGSVKDYIFNPDQIGSINKENLIQAIVEATNNALQKARNYESEKKKEIAGKVNIPDMPGLF